MSFMSFAQIIPDIITAYILSPGKVEALAKYKPVIGVLQYGFYRNEIITAYIEFVGIVVGFYFGQRAAETKKEKGEQKLLTLRTV